MNFLQDLRYALRTLLQKPGFTVIAVVAIAMAVGANTAMFSVVHGILLKRLPYADPDRLQVVYLTNPEQNLLNMPFSMADFLDWRAQNRAFDKIAAYSNVGFNVTGDGPPEQIGPAFYLSHMQVLAADFDLVIRTSSDPLLIATAVREELWKLDRDVPVVRSATMNERMSAALAEPRFRTLLLSAFAGVALLLAAVGIYGVVSYSVTLRTHEIGVRVSLGARRRDVLRMVLGEGLMLTAMGVGLGLIGAIALTRVMRTLLFEVTPEDPLTLMVVSFILIGIAVAACYIPARRAVGVDPLTALRR